MAQIEAVVFDIGNVLIRWHPDRAIARTHPQRPAALDWLERVGFYDWNLEQDRGRTLAEALPVIDAAHPGAGAVLADYRDTFADTIREPISGTWALAERLAARGVALHAITNWSAELFPVARGLYPRLETLFGVTVVSGAEGMIKPDPAIYALLCERAGVAAGDCLFVDDSPKNVKGALAAGMAAHHFTGPEGLEADLMARGLL